MNPIEWLFWNIPSMEILGNAANILGLFWLLALMFIAYRRIRPTIREKDKRWKAALLCLMLSFYIVFFFQMLLDDTITTPINLLFGAWEIRAPALGEFTIMKLLMTKFDVYGMIAGMVLVFYIGGIWKFLHITWKSAFWLTLVLLFSLAVAQTHWWLHLRFEGWMRVQVFWLSYPEFRILTGFLVESLIKKPEGATNRIS
jgi:hypothetical protein